MTKFKIEHCTDNEDEYSELMLVIKSWYCVCGKSLTNYQRHATHLCLDCDSE